MIQPPETAVEWLVNGAIALVGGLLRFFQTWRNNLDWTRLEIALEATISILSAGFAGALTYLLMRSKGIDPLYTSFAIGIMGHMGVEGISLLREKLNVLPKPKKK